MTYRERQRLLDILAAIDTIRSHLTRGTLGDVLVFDAVRVHLLEVGEAVKALPEDLVRSEPTFPWRHIAGMRDQLAHRYFDTSHAIVAAMVEHDLGDLYVSTQRILDANRTTTEPIGALTGRLIVGSQPRARTHSRRARPHNAPVPLETALNG